jgi:hypothetical protein
MRNDYYCTDCAIEGCDRQGDCPDMKDMSDEDFIKCMKQFAQDHEPDGYPCVQMWHLTRLCDLAERRLK